MKLTGNTILITGGSSGIGLALATRFVELGNEVIITGRNQAKLDAAKEALPAITAVQCDAADPAAILALAASLQESHPKLNVLINNAGIFLYKNLTGPTTDLTDLTRDLDINVAGPIRTTSAFIKTLTANNGTLINVSSGLAFVPLQCAPIYCATKAALHSYTLGLRQQLEGKLEVIELMPPAVKTALTSDLPDDGTFAMLTCDELMEATFKGLKAGALEIRPGQANQLHWMSRIAPGFINGQLAKGSASLVPPPEA